MIGEAGRRALGREGLRRWDAGQRGRRDAAGGLAAASFGVTTQNMKGTGTSLWYRWVRGAGARGRTWIWKKDEEIKQLANKTQKKKAPPLGLEQFMKSSLTSGVVRSRGATRSRRSRRETLCGGAREAVAGGLVETWREATTALHRRRRCMLR